MLRSRLHAVEDEFARVEKERGMGKATLERDDCIEEAVYRASMQHQIRRTMVGGSCKDTVEKRKEENEGAMRSANTKTTDSAVKP